ncbi:hypothetical protein V8E53_006741 [Lactarius tabidus]
MNSGSGVVHNIYSRSNALLPSSSKFYVSLGRGGHEVRRRFVSVVVSGFASMTTSIAGGMHAIIRVSTFLFNRAVTSFQLLCVEGTCMIALIWNNTLVDCRGIQFVLRS